jgi:putative methyltransferase (TIGR04325 family)
MRSGWLPSRNGLRRRLRSLGAPSTPDGSRHVSPCSKYESQGWTTNEPASGWNQDSVAVAQEAHWPVLVRNLEGPGPLGVSHLPTRTRRDSIDDHNIMMSYGYVLARAARSKRRISILDWGGGLGHYYLYSRSLLPEVAIDYHCFDVPVLCRVGRRLQPDVRFHTDANDLTGVTFDLVISSSSLHYFQDWRSVVDTLGRHTGAFLYIARLMTVPRAPSFVVRQYSREGYRTEFLIWFLNRVEVIECVQRCGLRFEREFVFAENWPVENAPEQGQCRGFLFQRQA